MEMAFKSAVDRINSDGKLIPRSRLLAQVEKVEKSDSFSASKKGKSTFAVCPFNVFSSFQA